MPDKEPQPMKVWQPGMAPVPANPAKAPAGNPSPFVNRQNPENPLDILVIHGPNLNILGKREPEIYGTHTLDDVNKMMKTIAEKHKIEINFFQSNHEGAIVDKIHEVMDTTEGIIINPGGLTHTSVALRDALVAYRYSLVEVHISNIYGREDFRKESLISPVATGVISGFGIDSYRLAMMWMVRNLEEIK